MQNRFGLLSWTWCLYNDHCLGYRHDYLIFYQLPNSNLFTHRVLYSWEKPLVKPTALGSTFPTYSFPIYLLPHFFQIYYSKNPKIHWCTFLHLLFCVLVRSIYPISYKLIYLFTVERLTTSLTRRVASICSLCAGTVYIALRGPPPRFDNLGFITEGNTYRRCAASSLPL